MQNLMRLKTRNLDIITEGDSTMDKNEVKGLTIEGFDFEKGAKIGEHLLGCFLVADNLNLSHLARADEKVIRRRLRKIALFHDIGKSNQARKTGYNPIDSFLWLKENRDDFNDDMLYAVISQGFTEWYLRGVDLGKKTIYNECVYELCVTDDAMMYLALLEYIDSITSEKGVICSIARSEECIKSKYGDSSREVVAFRLTQDWLLEECTQYLSDTMIKDILKYKNRI